MPRRPTTLELLFALGLAMATIGFALILVPTHDTDTYFRANLPRPSYTGRNRPVVLIDEAHANHFTIEGPLQPLARLLRDDGYFVGPNLRLITGDSLRGVAALIVANPDAWLTTSAFSQREIAALHNWVQNGGSLLLAIDPGPPQRAATALAAAFQVTFGPGNATTEPQLLRRDADQILPHPITDGRMRVEQVEHAMLFGWQSLTGPGPAFLKHPNGQSLAVAAEIGKGRIVALGNASMITAQRRGTTPVGFNRGGNDNVRLALNLLHWLTHQ
ncbi:MAG: hypothetical protein JST93_25515 [Acidobacteria bacterium]|nr:hypothetical protein [Acidobacteriota bacterium]